MNLRHPLSLGLLAAAAALVVSGLLATLAGSSPTEAAVALWDGMFGSAYAIGSSLNAAAVLLLVATGFIIAFRANLVNVGGEGQICLGAIFAVTVGTRVLPDSTPAFVALPAVLVASVVGGALWASIAAVLRVRRGVSEVITTLLLNFVGLALLLLVVHEEMFLRQPMSSSETLPQSLPLVDGAHLPLLGIPRSPATAAVALALLGAVVAAVVLHRTSTGLRLRSVGLSAPASHRLGARVDRLRLGSLTTAGGFAGLAGGVLVASAPHVLAEGVSSGYGFSGLVAGLLARGSLAAAVLVSAALGLLVSGGINLQLAAGIPASLTQITEALLILFIAGSALWTTTGPRGAGRRSAGWPRRRPEPDRSGPPPGGASEPSPGPATATGSGPDGDPGPAARPADRPRTTHLEETRR
ncbi:membrane protein [Paraoerskovia sediminicola]|uniref:Membrane protein n=1 Tax=Paraoerskovia sediminicola TaxID=1138587 RepID=A0ABM8G080_9CELL|nr:hypothetical protein [Paraoerskovia sediminicola]BDZ41401.1 membrane protein [Paraoerskovia sediminicola]